MTSMSDSSSLSCTSCPLCTSDGGTLIWRDSRVRVIRIEEPHYPGFCRVVWQTHVKEMTDLAPAERDHLMSIVFQVEQAIRQIMAPDKINLASLGNQVPHLHWHIIPRFNNDLNFPHPIWSSLPNPNAAKETTSGVLSDPVLASGWQLAHAERQAQWLPLITHLQASLGSVQS